MPFYNSRVGLVEGESRMRFFEGVLANLDGTPDIAGDILDEETAVSIPSGKVPVTLYHLPTHEDFHLGTAQLFYNAGKLLYRIEFSEECVAPTSMLERYYPCIGGFMKRRNGTEYISGISIDSLILNVSGNTDPRIGTLGEQSSRLHTIE
jgi:hypothetical protein